MKTKRWVRRLSKSWAGRKMEDKEAYDKLNKERPVIIYKLLNFAVSMHSAEALARRVSDHRDLPELRDLIEAAARYIKDGQN